MDMEDPSAQASNKTIPCKPTARGSIGSRSQQSTPHGFECMDTGQLASGSSTTMEDDTETPRSFAGCKRTNKGNRYVPSLGSTDAPSIDIEECMDIDEKLNLKGYNEPSVLETQKAEELIQSSESKALANTTEGHLKEPGLRRESPLIKRLVSGRDSPLKGRLGTEGLPYRSPLHSSISDLSEKEHCESLCVEVDEVDESLTEKLQAVESELEYMAGQNAADREDYAPDIKRIRLEVIIIKLKLF